MLFAVGDTTYAYDVFMISSCFCFLGSSGSLHFLVWAQCLVLGVIDAGFAEDAFIVPVRRELQIHRYLKCVSNGKLMTSGKWIQLALGTSISRNISFCHVCLEFVLCIETMSWTIFTIVGRSAPLSWLSRYELPQQNCKKKSFAFYLRATLNLVLGWLQCGFALDSGYAKYCKSSCQEPWSNTSKLVM